MTTESDRVYVFDIKEIFLPKVPPDDGITIAAIATFGLLPEMLNRELTSLAIVTVAGRKVRFHYLRGIPSALADETFRYVAQRTRADALAVVHAAQVPPGVRGDRAFLVCGESATAGYDNLVVVRDATPPDEPSYEQFGTRRDTSHPHRWLGVGPDPFLDLRLDDIVEWGVEDGEA